MRFEFFEILVRIAHGKYVQTGLIDGSNNARALHRLVNEKILTILLKNKLPEWQTFRDK